MSHNPQASNQGTPLSTINRTTGVRLPDNAAVRAADLAEKEAKLMAEIESLHQRPYSPFIVPSKIDLTEEQRRSKRQQDHVPSPRPHSRASSTRSTYEDLVDKEAKLLQEIEEMERKPFNPQKMVAEREQWYPEGNSKREIDNKSPLPFSFDNLTTKGVRGNIATAAAIDRPRPPIYPIVVSSLGSSSLGGSCLGGSSTIGS